MGRGSDDRPLALERPMPLRVASTEGLGRIIALVLLKPPSKKLASGALQFISIEKLTLN